MPSSSAIEGHCDTLKPFNATEQKTKNKVHKHLPDYKETNLEFEPVPMGAQRRHYIAKPTLSELAVPHKNDNIS